MTHAPAVRAHVEEDVRTVTVTVYAPGRWPVSISVPAGEGPGWLVSALDGQAAAGEVPPDVLVRIEMPALATGAERASAVVSQATDDDRGSSPLPGCSGCAAR